MIDNLLSEIVTDVEKMTKSDDFLTNLIYTKSILSKIRIKKGVIL